MTKLRTDLQRTFSTHSAVRLQDLTAAVKLVESAGSLEAVQTLADVFTAASSRGLVDGNVREAFSKELARLVHAAPAGVDPTLTRLNETQLKARLTKLTGVIEQQRAEIGTLETDIAATISRIESKSWTASALLTQKESLQRTLKERNNRQVELGVVGLLYGFRELTANAALEISRLKDQISSIDADIARTRSEQAQLQASLGSFRTRQSSLRARVDALRQVESSLRAQIPAPVDLSTVPPAQRFTHLAQSVQANQRLSANLAAQITALKGMKAEAGAFEHALDALIVGLEAEAKGLKEQIKLADRAILSALFDIVVGTTDMDPNLDVGPFSVSKKTVLLDGVTGLKTSLIKQAQSMVDQMVMDQLIPAAGSEQLAGRLLDMLKGNASAKDVADTARDVLTDRVMSSLSEPQRFLVDLVLTGGPTGSSRKALIEAIVDNAAITDPQARAIAAAFSGGATDLDDMVAPAGQTPVEAALTLLRHHGGDAAAEAIADAAAEAIADVVGNVEGGFTWLFLTSPSVRDARAVLAYPALQRLHLTDVSAEALDVLAALPSLNMLKLYGAHSQDVVKALASFTSLSELELYSGFHSAKYDDKMLKSLEPMTSLKRLSAVFSRVTGASIGASSVGHRLVSLDLTGTVQGAADLLALAKLPHLEQLDLSHTDVSASQVLQLAQSSSLQQIRVRSTYLDCAALNKQVGRQLFTDE